LLNAAGTPGQKMGAVTAKAERKRGRERERTLILHSKKGEKNKLKLKKDRTCYGYFFLSPKIY
jgi:hypothetical protein